MRFSFARGWEALESGGANSIDWIKDMSNVKQGRESNVELLRILAAAGVVVLHYNNKDMGGAFAVVQPGSRTDLLLNLLECFFICAVNLFVLITGFYMYRNPKRDLLKPLSLFWQVILFSVGAYLITAAVNGEFFSGPRFLNSFLPTNWFVTLYAVLYVISPFLNASFQNLSEKGRQRGILILLVIFSLWPTLADEYMGWRHFTPPGIQPISMLSTEAGYSIVNFCLLYLLGCFLRVNVAKEKNLKIGWLGLALVINVLLIFAWTQFDAKHGISSAGWDYCNPLIISEAVLLFLFFRKINLGVRPWINEFSKAAFTVYIFHEHVIRYVQAQKYVQISARATLIHLFLVVVGILLASFIIYEIYNFLMKPLMNFISKRWRRWRFLVVNGIVK